MASFEAIAFAPDGEHLACSTADGRLKIWETATGVLKQEYTPSAHLSATCSCLSWGFNRQNTGSGRKKKKRKSDVVDSAFELNLLAVGTHSGSILLYSVAKGDLQSELNGGHSRKVSAVCWNSRNNFLYSGSTDQHLVEWNLQTGEVQRKWKQEKSKGVTAMCLSEDGKSLITGSRKIIWWDLETLQVLKRFTGHATSLSQLLYISYPGSTDSEGRYSISSAQDDRVINAWQLNKESDDINALASFTLSEKPVLMDISRPNKRDQTLLLVVLTNDGLLQIFEHHLNGKCKAPLKPVVTITVCSSGLGDEKEPMPIPVACMQLCNDENRNILLAYGNSLHLKFEKVPFSSKEPHMVIIRKDPTKIPPIAEVNAMKVKTPRMNSEVKVIAPAHMSSSISKPSKKKKKLQLSEMPMEERLNTLTIESASSEPPRISNLSQLLLQGLQSKDADILSNVLTNDDDEVIINTVSRLPMQALVPLMTELQNRILNTNSPSHSFLKWIRCIFTKHTSFLVTLPDLDNVLGPLHQIFVSRTHLFEKISRLRGRLDLVNSQLASRKSSSVTDNMSTEALLIYQDESSDEAEVFNDVPSHSETEDDWDESIFSESEEEDENMDVEENEHASQRHTDNSDDNLDYN